MIQTSATSQLHQLYHNLETQAQIVWAISFFLGPWQALMFFNPIDFNVEHW